MLFSVLRSRQRVLVPTFFFFFFLYRSDLPIPSKTHLEFLITDFKGGFQRPASRIGNLTCKTDKRVKGQLRAIQGSGPPPARAPHATSDPRGRGLAMVAVN